MLLNTANTWFTLNRHDEPAPIAPEPPPEPAPAIEPAPEPAVDNSGEPEKSSDKDLGDAGKRAIDAMKRERNAARSEAAALRAKVTEYEDAQKTESEKLAAAKDAAEAKAVAAINRAVAAEIKVLASDAEFADPTDAEGAINPRDFVDDKGDIDVDGIKTRLAEILVSKPHWRKQASTPAPPKTPKPDPGQGSRGEPRATDFRTASTEDYHAELTRMGVKPRSR